MRFPWLTPRLVVLDKRIGETPLAAMEEWRKRHPRFSDAALCYAGRLDPMASGKLLVLIGEECKRQERYHALDKEYEIEVLLDIGSDTGDVLGIAKYAQKETHPDAATLRAALLTVTGSHEVPYPAFSSKTVAGKPLFLHALEETLDTIEIPRHIETIYTISLLGTEEIETRPLRGRVDSLLALAPVSDEPSKALGADFRIKAVRESWEKALAAAGERHFALLKLRVFSASGTYMRTLAGRIGRALDTDGLALSIRRTRIGKY